MDNSAKSDLSGRNGSAIRRIRFASTSRQHVQIRTQIQTFLVYICTYVTAKMDISAESDLSGRNGSAIHRIRFASTGQQHVQICLGGMDLPSAGSVTPLLASSMSRSGHKFKPF